MSRSLEPMTRGARAALISLFAGLVLCASPTATADVFTWKDPQTGRTRMSNIAPPWLKDGTRGPRVEVIRENKLIDPARALANPQLPAEPSVSQRAAARQQDPPKPPSATAARNEVAEEDEDDDP